MHVDMQVWPAIMVPDLESLGLNMMMCLFSSCSAVTVRAALKPAMAHAGADCLSLFANMVYG